MPPKDSSRTLQPYLEILKLVKLVQQPPNDAAAAKQLILGIQHALDLRTQPGLFKQQHSSREAAELSTCVAAALQCAGWLVAGGDRTAASAFTAYTGVTKCALFARQVLQHVPVGPELRRAVLQPDAGPHVPGLTTWLPLAAAQLVNHPEFCLGPPLASLPAPAPAVRGGSSSWLMTEELLVGLWYAFYIAWCLTDEESVERFAWLHPAVLQLTDKVLRDQVLLYNRLQLLHSMATTAATAGTCNLGHPYLAAAAGRQPDVKLGEKLAAMVREVCWWRVLASICEALAVAGVKELAAAAAQSATPGPVRATYPSSYCPPYYQVHAYEAHQLAQLPAQSQNMLTNVLHILLVAQLWDVWPWQLQRMHQPLQGAASRQGSASAAAAPALASADSSSAANASTTAGSVGASGSISMSSSVRGAKGGRMPNGGVSESSSSNSAGICGNHDSDGRGNRGACCDSGSSKYTGGSKRSSADGSGSSGVSSRASSQADHGHPTSSSSSSAAGAAFSESTTLVDSSYWAEHQAIWQVMLGQAMVGWPLLPSESDAGTMQPQAQQQQPVALVQLQLAVCGFAYASRLAAPTAGLLLAVLLQQADPGLRASFLAGPGGNTLLAACQHWGYYVETPSAGSASDFHFLEAPLAAKGPAPGRLVAALHGNTIALSPGDWHRRSPGSSLALLLAWCYLQPQPQWGTSPQVCSAGPEHTDHFPLISTPLHHSLMDDGKTATPECFALRSTPCASLRFAPGCAPTPLLLGMLEALLRAHRIMGSQLLLKVTTVFVHATVVWMLTGWAGGSSNSSCSSGNGSRVRHDPDSSAQVSAGSSSDGSSGSSGHGISGGSASSSSSAVPGAIHSELLQAMSSLAVTLSASLAEVHTGLAGRQGQEVQPLHATGCIVLPCCSIVAANLLHLAAQQLQVRGPQALPALQLAAAAQRLAGVCGEVATACTARLSRVLQSPSVHAQSPEQTMGLSSQDHTDAVEASAAMDTLSSFLRRAVAALQQVQPWWQQGAGQQQQQQEDCVQADAARECQAGPSGSSTSGMEAPGCDSAAAHPMPVSCSSTDALAAATSMATAGGSSSSSSRPGGAGGPSMVAGATTAARVSFAGRRGCSWWGAATCAAPTLSGPSAEGLVAGRKGVRCGGCRVARYCSPNCQQADWLRHRRVCRRLAAAAVPKQAT